MLLFVHVLLVSSVLKITGGYKEKDGSVIPTSKPGFTTRFNLLKLVDMSDVCATTFKRSKASKPQGIPQFTLSEHDYQCVEIPPPKFEPFDMGRFRVSTCFSLVAVMHYCAGVQLITQSVVNAFVSGNDGKLIQSLGEMFESMSENDRKYFFAVIYFMGSLYDSCQSDFCPQLVQFMSFFDGVAGEDDSAMFPNEGLDGYLNVRTYTSTQNSQDTLKWVVANYDTALAELDTKTFQSRLHREFRQ